VADAYTIDRAPHIPSSRHTNHSVAYGYKEVGVLKGRKEQGIRTGSNGLSEELDAKWQWGRPEHGGGR
jgi:hypothetical protein